MYMGINVSERGYVFNSDNNSACDQYKYMLVVYMHASYTVTCTVGGMQANGDPTPQRQPSTS